MKQLITVFAVALLAKGLWTHEWRLILASVAMAAIWPAISDDVGAVGRCTCAKGARCQECIDRDGLIKPKRSRMVAS